jgi:phage-related protein
MPERELIYYQEANGEVPLRIWLDGLQKKPKNDCFTAMSLLETYGHELHRPHAGTLGGGIHELRIKWKHINLRILYFFHGRDAVVLTHGLAKEKKVPPREIALAKKYMANFLANPSKHSFKPEPEEI